jgi:hypothetical protein
MAVVHEPRLQLLQFATHLPALLCKAPSRCNIDQRDKDDVRQGFESVEIIGLDRLRVTAGMA